MTVYFVSRHPGARDWAREEGLGVDAFVAHIDPDQVAPGDRVIGALPMQLAAAVCARGARYLHLVLPLSAQQRGRELSAHEMRLLQARVEEFCVRRCD